MILRVDKVKPTKREVEDCIAHEAIEDDDAYLNIATVKVDGVEPRWMRKLRERAERLQRLR